METQISWTDHLHEYQVSTLGKSVRMDWYVAMAGIFLKLNRAEKWRASRSAAGAAMGEGFVARGEIVDSGQMDDRSYPRTYFTDQSCPHLPRKPIVKIGSLWSFYAISFSIYCFRSPLVNLSRNYVVVNTYLFPQIRMSCQAFKFFRHRRHLHMTIVYI